MTERCEATKASDGKRCPNRATGRITVKDGSDSFAVCTYHGYRIKALGSEGAMKRAVGDVTKTPLRHWPEDE